MPAKAFDTLSRQEDRPLFDLISEVKWAEKHARKVLSDFGLKESEIEGAVHGDLTGKLYDRIIEAGEEEKPPYFALEALEIVSEIRNAASGVISGKDTAAVANLIGLGVQLGVSLAGMGYEAAAIRFRSRHASNAGKHPKKARPTRAMVRIVLKHAEEKTWEGFLRALETLADTMDENPALEKIADSLPVKSLEVDRERQTLYFDTRSGKACSVTFHTLKYDHFNKLTHHNSG